jgi:hypothetical protein
MGGQDRCGVAMRVGAPRQVNECIRVLWLCGGMEGFAKASTQRVQTVKYHNTAKVTHYNTTTWLVVVDVPQEWVW